MDTKQLKQDIIDYAYTIGIDSIGFTTADPFDELKQKLEAYHANGYASGFEESDITYGRSLNYPYQQQDQS